MTPGEWGQLAVCWIAISFATAPYIGRHLRRLRQETTVRLPRDPMKYEGRDLTEAQKRKAEALGFMDDAKVASSVTS